jgi:hypothetical protein
VCSCFVFVSTINYQGKKQRIVDSQGRVHYRCEQAYRVEEQIHIY